MSKTRRGVDKPRRKVREPSRRGDQRRHLGRTLKYSPHDGAHDPKGQKQTQWSGRLKSRTHTDEKTDTDTAAETDEGDVA